MKQNNLFAVIIIAAAMSAAGCNPTGKSGAKAGGADSIAVASDSSVVADSLQGKAPLGTPDMRMYNLRGPVDSVIITFTKLNENLMPNENETPKTQIICFDSIGNLRTLNFGIRPIDLSADTAKLVTRNDEGQIVTYKFDGDNDDSFEYKFVYDSNGRWTSTSLTEPEGMSEEKYTYDDDGNLTQKIVKSGATDEGSFTETTTYTNKSVDPHGNPTTRLLVAKKEFFDSSSKPLTDKNTEEYILEQREIKYKE